MIEIDGILQLLNEIQDVQLQNCSLNTESIPQILDIAAKLCLWSNVYLCHSTKEIQPCAPIFRPSGQGPKGFVDVMGPKLAFKKSKEYAVSSQQHMFSIILRDRRRILTKKRL
jgi:hypothetical protein